MQRREVDGMCGIAWSTVKGHYADWIKTKQANVLLQVAPKKDPAMILFDAVSNYKADNILMLRHLVEFKNLDPKRAALPDGYNLLHASELAGDSTGITEYLLDKGIDPKIEFIEGDDEEPEETVEDEYQEENPSDFELDDTVRDVLDQALEIDAAKEHGIAARFGATHLCH